MEASTSKFDFTYPFPTLKQRAILTVCRHWIDNSLVQQFCDGSSGLVCLECEKYVSDLMPAAIDRFVDHLPVPNALKADIYQVLNGLCDQLSLAFGGFFCCSNHKLGVYIDDLGRFDYLGFLRCCFKKSLDKDKGLQVLYALFTIACKLCLLPEIDMVLRKIVTKIDGGERDSEMLLEQTTNISVVGKQVVTYRFLNKANANRIDRLNELSSHMDSSSCQSNEEHTTITLEPANFNVDALKEHNRLLSPVFQTNIFISYLIFQGKHWLFGTAHGLEIIKYLGDERITGWASRFGQSSCSYLLNKLLDWPFTQFFVSTLHLLSPLLKDTDYCQLFLTVVSKIPQRKEPHYATLHFDLLHSLWSVMPLPLKQDCVDWQCAKDDKKEQLLCYMKVGSSRKRFFLKAMLELRIRAPSFYNELVTEMQAMFDEK